MSNFAVTIKRIRGIEMHPNADAIELALIDGYRSIVKKGEFKAGDLIAYIPEAALLPEWLLKRLNFWDEEKSCGKLNGKEGNRVKAIRLRGELSQGICYPVDEQPGAGQFIRLQDAVQDAGITQVTWPVREGDDVAEVMGIAKYEPPIPVNMAGEVFNAGQHLTLKFDVENWKAYPDVLQDGEEVIFTEKLHGTCTMLAILPLDDAHPEAFGEKQNILIFSKGLGAQGLVFKNNERNKDNLYVRATRELVERIDAWQHRAGGEGISAESEPLFILGETFGPGVQDLTYGKELGFRIFAAARGYREKQSYFDWADVEAIAKQYAIATVPVLYRGPFSTVVMHEYTDGKTTLGAQHIREGIVMVPAKERFDPKIGRVCLKSVSADYLTRKGGSEYQ